MVYLQRNTWLSLTVCIIHITHGVQEIMGHSQLQIKCSQFYRRKNWNWFQNFYQSMRIQTHAKIGVHELFHYYKEKIISEFALIASIFILLTWISFSAISLDSLDKMLKTKPKKHLWIGLKVIINLANFLHNDLCQSNFYLPNGFSSCSLLHKYWQRCIYLGNIWIYKKWKIDQIIYWFELPWLEN